MQRCLPQILNVRQALVHNYIKARNMQINNQKNHTGFSILEVIIATVIFGLVAAGLYASITALRTPVSDTTKKINAALIAKEELEKLRSEVRAENWVSGGALMPSATPYELSPVQRQGVTYYPSYVVQIDPNGSPARKVTMTVTW
jgi:prepilin-type N-terminal cleavage/methylation domain-containing protein